MSEKTKITKPMRKTLKRIERMGGHELLRPQDRVPATVAKLIAAGLVELLPGLIPDAPQGYAIKGGIRREAV